MSKHCCYKSLYYGIKPKKTKKQTEKTLAKQREIRHSLSDIVFHWNTLGSAIIVQNKN